MEILLYGFQVVKILQPDCGGRCKLDSVFFISIHLPQLAEINTPRAMDVAGECFL